MYRKERFRKLRGVETHHVVVYSIDGFTCNCKGNQGCIFIYPKQVYIHIYYYIFLLGIKSYKRPFMLHMDEKLEDSFERQPSDPIMEMLKKLEYSLIQQDKRMSKIEGDLTGISNRQSIAEYEQAQDFTPRRVITNAGVHSRLGI